MAETTNLMTIGQFSSLSRLSVRMLRHYDSHGVLVPTDIDPSSGYRFYSSQQLVDAADIRNLRDVGFGVSAIGILLAARGTPAWHHALQLQREGLVDELRTAQGRVSLITRLLDQEEETMSITITRSSVPAMTIVALRGTVPTYSDEGELWEQLTPILHDQAIVATGPCGVIEHDDQYTERDVDLSIFITVAPDTRVGQPAEVIDLPERDCVIARVQGPYDQISHAHDLISARIAAENLTTTSDNTIASKSFNRYLTTLDQVGEDELLTEVCVPLA